MKYGNAFLLSKIHFKVNESFLGEDTEFSNDNKKSKKTFLWEELNIV